MRFRGHSPQAPPDFQKTLPEQQQQLLNQQHPHYYRLPHQGGGNSNTLPQRRSSSTSAAVAATSTANNNKRPFYSWWPSNNPRDCNPKQKESLSSSSSLSSFQTAPLLLHVAAPPLFSPSTGTPENPPCWAFLQQQKNLRSNDSDSNNMSSLNAPTSEATSASIPKLAFREISLGALVGQGGFSDVKEITAVDLDDVFDTSHEDSALRRSFAAAVNDKGTSRSHSNPKRFVLKSLRTDLPEDEHTKGVLDLAIEADILATLRHPNIISLRAMANSDPHDVRFFVVLDRLSITLERKFNAWRKLVNDASGVFVPCYGYCCSKGHILHNLWKERLEVAMQTAQAMEYLHAQGVVYRDLKPDNIGFDAETNVVKLFDFGLAKRLRDAEKAPENGHPAFSGLYHLTGNTGSLRYMAPEVAKCLPYDQTVDAYSFGILFWQICSLTTPYAKYSTKMHAERVVRQGHRPKPDSSWPPTWIQLQQACWSSDKSLRPPFSQIVETLRDQLDMMAQEDGVVPSRASEIRAKKKKKRVKSEGLDVDTRNTAAMSAAETGTSSVEKRYDNDII